MTGKMNLRDKLDDDTLDLSLMDLETVPVKEIVSEEICLLLLMEASRIENYFVDFRLLLKDFLT